MPTWYKKFKKNPESANVHPICHKNCHQKNTLVFPISFISYFEMYGLFVSNFENYITLKYGQEAWNNIRILSNIGSIFFQLLDSKVLSHESNWPNDH